ncbi:hypothetical protein JB92DRAFT_2699369 [Gautieria morchelliformis]|nr:hypothetical protein JB92DRAFT_2699369 [Gautieria morchelliformis]
MDPRASLSLFSRGATPPPKVIPNRSPEEVQPLPPPPQHRPETQEVSHHQPQPSPVHDIDALLRGLSSNTQPPPSTTQPSVQSSSQTQHSDTSSTTQTNPTDSHTDKQNALLHNLMNPSGYSSPPTQPQSDQMQRANPSPQGGPNDSQGKQLLEQLMAGGQPEGRPPFSSHISYSQPPPTSTEIERTPYPLAQASEPRSPQQQWTQAHQPQAPPSPPRKSMFDFVSPFDALAASAPSGPSPSRKKPVPPMNPIPPQPSSSNDESSISVEERRNRDAKRQSVENLLSEFPNPAQSISSPPQQHAVPQEQYAPQEPYHPPLDARSLLGKPSGPRTESPRGSPKTRHRGAAQEPTAAPPSNLGTPQGQQQPGNIRDRPRDVSPTSRSKRGQAPAPKKLAPPSTQQTIIFDVSQPLDSTLAPQNSVKATAIALVKIEPVFLPGSTIGATSWIAYAMTKGRVRIISRSSGDRTLLQLPSAFPPTSSVIDMVVSGNRLAGVTSDGGFVVWELPKIIEDDVAATLLVCVAPALGHQSGLKSVKWHPKQPDTLAVASDTRIHLINVNDAVKAFRSEPITQMDLHQLGQAVQVPSPIVGFAFDVPHFAIATISEDSTLTLWNIRDKLPFWHHKVLGEGTPSSIDFLDGGIIIGRKYGTIFQLLSVMGQNVLSTVKFVNGDHEDTEMFGHVAYDSRIQTLWVANSRRESLIALRVSFETATPGPSGEEVIRGGYFEQIVEFTGPKASIHFVILTPDTDPSGEEAHAACVAAKLPPGDLALVAFVVHSTGVDQVLIRKEWFDTALNNAEEKLPGYNGRHHPLPAPQQQQPPPAVNARPQQPAAVAAPSGLQQQMGMARQRTPLEDEVDLEVGKDDNGRAADARGKYGKTKGAPPYKDTERELAKDKDKGKESEKAKAADLGPLSDSPVAASLTKEIRKALKCQVEENLHTRIGRLMAKELDKQHHRLEEIRQTEQRNEFDRQQTILKLISTELTKNTTRVVESAVKSEVQQSVLPALEKITKDEVKMAMNGQISKGLTDSMQQTLPVEIERLLLRPDVSNHVARTFSSAVTPVIEKHVKDAITNTLIPAYTQISSTMHQELSREIHGEILNLKKEVITWQSEALRGQETLIRDMEHSIRALADQVKLLSLNMPVGAPLPHVHQTRAPASPPAGGAASHGHAQLPSHIRQSNHPLGSQMQSYAPQGSYGPPPPPGQAQNWYPPPSLPSQATPPSSTQSVGMPPTSSKNEDWEEVFMSVLGGQDLRQLRELLARSNPEVILPSNGKGPLSQAVVLTLIHRLASIVNDSTPGDEAYKSSLWWLQRTSSSLNPSDDLISPYIARLLPNIQQTLTSARQRLILPGMPSQFSDTSRVIHDIQDVLGRKPMPSH